MKKVATLITILAVLAFVGSALATAPGKTVDYEGGMLGKVVFDGTVHKDAGNTCMDCHPKLFGEMKPGKDRVEVPSPHKPGELCHLCHTGEEGKPSKSCTSCHKK